MKKIIAGALLAASSTMSFAAGPAGCGLGTAVVFKDANEWHEHVLAATTNGTSGNQTFGITFGTLGCDGTGTVTSSEKIALFIDGNMEQLARDMSKGEGETLATLAEAWGVADQDKAAFNALAQAQFSSVFTSENVTSQTVLENLNTVLASNAQLASYTLS